MAPTASAIIFKVLEGKFLVGKLPPSAEIPAQALTGEFSSVSRTADELSIVAPEDAKIPDVEFENAADELLGDLDISFSEHDESVEKFKLTRTHLRWMVSTALRLLEPVTIVEPPEEDEEMSATEVSVTRHSS